MTKTEDGKLVEMVSFTTKKNKNKMYWLPGILQIFKKVKLFYSIGILKYIPSKIVWQIDLVQNKCFKTDRRFEENVFLLYIGF